MYRSDIINLFIEKFNYKTYLEIGIDKKENNFNKIKALDKTGIDIDIKSDADFIISSDDFFRYNRKIFDIIFIDGLHVQKQVNKDIINSLKILKNNGTIILHDCNPPNKESTRIPRNEQIEWCGDVYKSWIEFRSIRTDLSMFVIDIDYGCGIIRQGNQKLLKINENIFWENFEYNKKKWLNLISFNDFLIWLKNGNYNNISTSN